MYRIELKLIDFKMLNSQKRIEWMISSPERADLYIDIENQKDLKKLMSNISDNLDIDLIFYRIYFNEIPKLDFLDKMPKKEIVFDLVMYGQSEKENIEEVENCIEKLIKNKRLDITSYKVEFREQ